MRDLLNLLDNVLSEATGLANRKPGSLFTNPEGDQLIFQGLGQIASAGLLIFLAGEPGRRVLTPNTSILSHQFSWGSDGKAHELFATMKEFELTHKRMVDHYKKCTGLDEEQIKTALLPPHDVYLTAEEALALNVCDVISSVQR